MKTRNKLTSHYSCRSALLLLAAVALQALPLGIAHAAFHLWAVTEVYSSPDGSVQFVRLTNNSTFTTEYFMAGHQIVCSGPQGTNTFNFPANLPAVSTLNKNFIIGTSNLASAPGGLTPDYVLQIHILSFS